MASKALKGLTIKIGGDTSDLSKSLEKVEKQGRSLSGELGQINKLLKMDPKNTELLAQKQKVLADAISTTEKKLGILKEAEKQVQTQFERGEVSEAQYRALQREIIETEAKLGKYKNAAKETADAVEKLGNESKETAKNVDKTGDEAKDAGSDIDGVAVAAAAAAAALLAMGKASIDAFTEVDDGADNVIRATGAVGAGAEALGSAYKNVATRVVAAFEDIGATVGEVNTRFGYTGKQLEDCSVDFMKFAEITGVNSADAVKSVTRALNDAGIPLNQYKILLDQLAKAGQAAGIDVTKLAEGLSINGATMRGMGLDTAESIALLAQFELSGADATTMLSGMKRAMANWAKEGKNGNREFEKLVEGVKDGSISAADALEVFGTRAGPQLVDAIKSGKFEYKDMLQILRKSEGTLEATFGELEDAGYSVQRSFQRIKVTASDMGEDILDAAAPALEELLDYLESEGVVKKFGNAIKKDIIPAIQSIGAWGTKNLPTIKSGLIGVTAALVAFKTASIATTVAQKGLKGAIIATTVAQKALNLVQNASPFALIATAVVGVTAAVMAYTAATKEARQPTQFLTDEEIALMEASREATEAFREQQKATQEAMGGILAEMDYVAGLASELENLADASGKVEEKDQARAQFILNELKEATGQEYQMIDGVIRKYDDLKQSIQNVIAQKTANALLEAVNADFVAALQGEAEAWDAVLLAQNQYDQQLALTEQAESDYAAFKKEYNEKLASGYYDYREAEQAADSLRLQELADIMEEEQGYLKTRAGELETATADYYVYSDKIIAYEQAQEAAAKGNYEAVREILTGKGNAFSEYSGKVETETNRILAALQKEAIDAGRKAQLTRERFEAGVEGYTEEMVKEAEEGYEAALDKFANAYADAHGFGVDLTTGMIDGAESKRTSLIDKARSLVEAFFRAVRKAADSHSPSRKAIAIFEDIGEGAEIGVENKTEDVARAGTEQAAALLDSYRAQEHNAQRALRNVAEQEIARQSAGQLTAATANSGALEAILAAIKEGQVLLLDGEAVVGGTAGKMDRKLGQLRVLAARGAR